MEAASSTGVGSPESTLDYSFGFDTVNFSDRTLMIEIIDDSEKEVSFMDFLNYVYSNKLRLTTLFPLLDLLEIADKFEVDSCLRDCSRSLQNFPMTFESASHYLDLSPSLLMSHTIKPLIDAAKQFVVAHFKDVERFKEEVLSLPLAGIQAVLSTDDLLLASEDAVYNLVLMWARKHYPDVEERREIIRTHLVQLVLFPLMTAAMLIEVLTCSDIDPELISKNVFCALHFKAETPHRQRCLAAEKDNAASRKFVERAYTFRPVKVIESELTRQQCITVYLDLKWEEVSRLFPDGHICSETFHLGGQELSLVGRCFLEKQTSLQFLLLSLLMQVRGSAAYTVDFEIESRMKPLEEFASDVRGSHTFTEGAGSYKYLLLFPWPVSLDDDKPYIINGILHLRADLKINKQDMRHSITDAIYVFEMVHGLV